MLNFGEEVLEFEGGGCLGYEVFLFLADLFFGDVKGAIGDGGVIILFVFEVERLFGLLDGLAAFVSADKARFDVFEAGVVFVFHLVKVFLHDEEGGFLVFDFDYFFLTSYFYHIEKSNMLMFPIINVIISPSSSFHSLYYHYHYPCSKKTTKPPPIPPSKTTAKSSLSSSPKSSPSTPKYLPSVQVNYFPKLKLQTLSRSLNQPPFEAKI